MDKIKLLIVDDSLMFRAALAKFIKADDCIELVGTAGNAYEARDLILNSEPDVMTLDIEMPHMDGIAFLKKLLPQYYIPTILISSSETRVSAAIEAGAVEFLPKPAGRTSADMQRFADTLCASIRNAALRRRTHLAQTQSRETSLIAEVGIRHTPESNPHIVSMPAAAVHPVNPEPPHEPVYSAPTAGAKFRKSDLIVALGASTGGTEALEQVMKQFPADFPPLLVVQHMPAGFTKLYAERLNKSCKMEVKEAVDGERLHAGLAIIGAGDHQLQLMRDSSGYYITSRPGEKVSGHCPSVDVMFTSIAENARGGCAIGAILTGMGKDGAQGLLKMRNAGAFTVGQDRESCVVYGMPMEAYNIGAVQVQAPLDRIASVIMEHMF